MVRRYPHAMSRPPFWRRLLDVLALLACISGVAGMSFGAIDADNWPVRVVLAAIAVALALLVGRGTRVVVGEWRSQSRSET